MENPSASGVSDLTSDGEQHPPLAPKPTLGTNRFAILSSSTVRKGNLLKSPVARDMCKLTERMVVSMHGGNSQISNTAAGVDMDDNDEDDSGTNESRAKHRHSKPPKRAASQPQEEGAELDVEVSSDDEEDYNQNDADGAKGVEGPSRNGGNVKSSSTANITMTDNRLMRIEQQFAGGKKAAARYAAKNCSQKHSELLKSKSHQELQHKFTHLLVTDFEATCDSAEPDYPHEIIEFPCVAVDLRTMKVVAEFGTFVRPVNNPILTPFCTELTTIQQSDVDAAPTMREALQMFDKWLAELKKSYEAEVKAATAIEEASHGGETAGELETTARSEASSAMGAPSPSATSTATSATRKNAGPAAFNPVFATDGPWDMRKFMHECHVIRDGIPFPEIFYKWIDVRRCFSDFFHKQLFKLTKMLRALGMTFIGERHRGIDDARNIARVAVALAKRGYKFRQTASIPFLSEGSRLLEHERAASALLKEIEEEEAQKKAHKKEKALKGKASKPSTKKSERKK